MFRLDNMRGKIYLHSKIVNYFENNEYKEGSYNDNGFVDLCRDYYYGCNRDSENLFFLIDGFLSDELGIKLTQHFLDQGIEFFPPVDEYCDKEIEYIDWAFATELYSCSWDVLKYREVKDVHPNDINLKWHNNVLTDWWFANKDRILRNEEETKQQREREREEFLKDHSYDSNVPW